LIEFCSRLSKSGRYKYNPKKEQKFAAIGCGCLNSRGVYKSSFKSCTHAAMIADDDLIDYVFSIVDDPKESVIVTENKMKAVNAYSSSINYESVCNKKLRHILESAK